ncbi:MAG: WhiB family transcriptional regulator [Acidimicrobiales bacterium]
MFAPATRHPDETLTDLSTLDLEMTIDEGPAANLAARTVDETWRLAAACRDADPTTRDLFFSEDLPSIAAAKRICAGCPVMVPCLEGAVARGEAAGVWGGQLFEDGRIVTVKRRRGRPSKNPRADDIYTMLPVPDHLEYLLTA